MYVESRYFISMLTAVQEQRSRLFYVILFMQKAVLEAEAACVIPGSSKRVSVAPVCSYRVVDFRNSLN